MANKTFLLFLVFFLCACSGGGGDDTNNISNSETDSNDQSTNTEPSTKLGEVCDISDSYYPLPGTAVQSSYNYRTPKPGDIKKYGVELDGSSVSDEGTDNETKEETNKKYESYTSYYSVSDLSAITPNALPPFTPSRNWATSVWNNENIILSLTEENSLSTSESSVYLYPNDGTVKTIKSENDVFAEYDATNDFWLWGKTTLPKLDTHTTYTVTSKKYDPINRNQRWNNISNVTVGATSIRMTGIGCIETILVQEDETRVLEFDDLLDDLINNSIERVDINSTYYIHPDLGAVISLRYEKGYLDQESNSETAVINQTKILSDINFYSDLPTKIIK